MAKVVSSSVVKRALEYQWNRPLTDAIHINRWRIQADYAPPQLVQGRGRKATPEKTILRDPLPWEKDQ